MSRAMQFDIVANDKASATMGKVDNSMKQFGKNMASSFAEGYAKASMYIAAVMKVVSTINELGKVSDDAARMGLSAEEYQRLKFAAEEYGGSIEEIAKAQKDVNKMLDEAATKQGGEAYKTLRLLGFSDKDIVDRKIKQIQVFERLSEAIKGAASEQDKFWIANRVLGDKISQSMVPVLENYDKFRQAQSRASEMSQKQADELDRVGESLGGYFAFVKNLGGAAIAEASMALRGLNKEPTLAVQPGANDEQKKKQAELAKALLNAPNKTGDSSKGAGEVSSMAAIGGSAFRGIAAPAAKTVDEQQLDTLNKIADNTAPTTPAPAPGSTNITNPPEASRGFIGTLQDIFSGPGRLEVNASK